MSEYSAEELQQLHKHIEMYECLKRLRENEDFKTLILDHYLRDEVIRSMTMVGVPGARDRREATQEDILAASLFNYFLLRIERFGEDAQKALNNGGEE